MYSSTWTTFDHPCMLPMASRYRQGPYNVWDRDELKINTSSLCTYIIMLPIYWNRDIQFVSDKIWSHKLFYLPLQQRNGTLLFFHKDRNNRHEVYHTDIQRFLLQHCMYFTHLLFRMFCYKCCNATGLEITYEKDCTPKNKSDEVTLGGAHIPQQGQITRFVWPKSPITKKE